MSTPCLNLVVVYACSLERAEQFYRILGLTFVREKHGDGPEHLSCGCGDVLLEIYPRQPGSQPVAPVRLGFRVQSVDNVVAELRRIGARILHDPTDSPWGWRAVAVDPDGYSVELTGAIDARPTHPSSAIQAPTTSA